MGRKIYGGRSAARQQTLKIPDKPSVSAKTGYGGGSGAGVPPWSLRFRLHWGIRPPVGRRRTGINPFRPFRCVPPGCPKGSGSPCFWGGAHRGNGRRPANSAGKHGRRFRRLRPDAFPGCPKPEACPAAKGFAGNAAEAETRIVRPLIRGCAAEMATKTGRRSGDLNKQDQRVQDMGRAESVPRRDGGFRFLWEKTGRLPGKPEKIREGIRERSATPPASAMEAIGPFSRRLDRKARLDFTIRFAIGFIQLKSACRCIRPLRTGPPLRPGSSGMRLRTAGTVWPYPFP